MARVLPEIIRKDAAGGRRGTGHTWQEVDRSTPCLRDWSVPSGCISRFLPLPAGFGGLGMWGAGFLSSDLTLTPSSKLGLGPMGTRKDGHLKSPIPTILTQKLIDNSSKLFIKGLRHARTCAKPFLGLISLNPPLSHLRKRPFCAHFPGEEIGPERGTDS